MMLRKSFFMFSMALRCTLLLILITGSVFKASFAAEPWPNRPVIIVNPWAAGGPAEGIIRPIADKLSSKFGQPFIIDTKSGANGTIGAAFVARAKPDG